MNEKTCKQCGKTKPLAMFYRDPKGADGYRTECKACKLENNAANKATKQAAGWIFA